MDIKGYLGILWDIWGRYFRLVEIGSQKTFVP